MPYPTSADFAQVGSEFSGPEKSEEEHDLLEPFDSGLLSSIPSRISLVCLSHQLEVFHSLCNN
jgi:hypothetical protein